MAFYQKMGIVVRQSVKSVIVTFFGILLGGLVTLFSSHYFPKAEYGFTQNLVGIVTSVSLVSLLGFTSALLVIGQRYPIGHPARGTFLTICALVPLAFSALVSLLFFLVREPFLNLYQEDDRARMDEFFVLFPLLTLVFAALAWIEGYLQSLNKIAIQTFAKEIVFRVFYLSIVFLYGFGVLTYGAFIWALVFVFLIPFFFLVIVARRAGGFTFELKKGQFSLKDVLDIIYFSAYHMLTILSMVLIYQFSPYLLGPLAENGLEAVAVFTVASFIVAVFRSPTRILGIAVTPTFSKTYIDKKFGELNRLFVRSSQNMQIIGCASFALVYLNIDSVQQLMSIVQEGYGEIKGIILILMLGQLVDMVTGFNYELIGVTKYFRFNFWLAFVILALVFLLNYLLIKEYNAYGAAWATSIGLIVYNLLKVVFLWKKLNIQPFSSVSWKIGLLTLICAFPAWLLPNLSNVYLDLFLRSLIFVVPFAYGTVRFRFSDELNTILRNVLEKRRLY